MPIAADAEQALRVADALPRGQEQVAASERAMILADEVGDLRLRVQARINLVAAYDAVRPGERELPHIAWLLGCLADAGGAAPRGQGSITERQRFEILWECRFALNRTRRSSSIPLAVVHRVYGDIGRRYRTEGVSPNLFAKHRALLARDVDDQAVVDRWLRVWRESPRDELSDCEACDAATDARFLAEAGDLPAALKRVNDLLEGRRGCDQEPHRLYGEAADWAMRLGRVDAAEAYHRAGWLSVSGRPEFVSAMADHVMYLVRTNRPGRAVRLVLSIVPLLGERAPARLDDVDRMCGAAVVARVLRAGRGHKVSPLVVDGLPLDTAIATFEGMARELASGFDARNRTKRVSQRLAGLVRITPYPEVASEEVRSVDLLDVALTRAQPPPTPPVVPLPDSALGYAAELLAASDAFDATRVMQLVNGWAEHRLEMLPVADPLEHLSVSYLERRALASDRAQIDGALVEQLLTGAAEAARLSGNQPAVQRVEIELLHRQALGGDDSAWSRAEKLVAELEGVGELREAAAALMTLSRNPDAAQGMEYALRAAELYERAGQPRWQVTALQAAGYAGVWADPRQAEALLLRAHDMALDEALPAVAVAITATRAKLAWQTGNLDHAILGYRDAVAASGEVGVTDPLGLRSELCDVLLQAGYWEELIDEAHELLARLEPGDALHRALAHRVLGLGLLETGNVHEAAEVLEPAALALARAGEALHAVTSWTLGRALLGSDRPDLAAPHFVAAATGFQAQGRLADAAAAHEAAGATLGRSGSTDEAAEHLVAAARLSRHLEDAHRMVSSLRQLAGVQATAGRVTEALSTLGSVIPEARSLAAAEPLQEERLRGLLEHQAALILMDGGRSDEAPPLLEDALTLLSAYGEGTEAAAAEDTYYRLTGLMWTGSGDTREDHAGGND
jgi:tetratricopeptide (TPR) repeat protein